MSGNFMACLTENVIEWTLIYKEQDGKAFYNNFIARCSAAKEFSFFFLSLLHEIGHFETEWEMKDDVKERNKHLSNEQYFNLFNEKIATDWAITWIEENIDTARSFDEKINNVLNEFYNEVLD